MKLTVFQIIELFIFVGGLAIGYGVMKATLRKTEVDVDKLDEKLRGQCRDCDKRFFTLETRQNSSEKSLAGIQSDVKHMADQINSVDSKIDKVDNKVDKVLTRVLEI